MAKDDDARGVHQQKVWSTRVPVSHRVRRQRVLPSNQRLITAFAVFSAFVVMVTYLETSRMLIPSKVVNKEDLHTLTSGFTSDLVNKPKAKIVWPSSLIPHPHLPSALFIGFSQCGGQSILSALSTHPDVVVNSKDLKFFTTNSKSLRTYLSSMPPSLDHQATVDACLTCVTDKTALSRIKSFNETIRVVIVLCDPIFRLLVNHTDFLRQRASKQNNQSDSFKDHSPYDLDSLKTRILLQPAPKQKLNIPLLEGIGDYFQYVVDLYQLFSRQQVLFIEKDRFTNNFVSEISRLHRFLEVRPYPQVQKSSYNKTLRQTCYTFLHGPSRPTCVKDSTWNITKLFSPKFTTLLESLRQFYKPYNRRLLLYLEDQYPWL